jgi:glycosidase
MKPVIYQLFVRLFGNMETGVKVNGTISENGCGKFNDINDSALISLKDLGATHIWYTGIIEHAVATDYSQFGIDNDYPEIIKGRAGSPYAIKDYYDVNPDLAIDINNRINEFQELVHRTHHAGMGVIIDFVPNHLARLYGSDSGQRDAIDFGVDDNPEKAFSAENDFYYVPGEQLVLPEALLEKAAENEYRINPLKYSEFPAKVTGNDCFRADPGINDWYETVKLNYGVDYLGGKQRHFDPVPAVWEKMKSVILYWAGKNVDGFRADMAEMVPLEFWSWLIKSVKEQYPGLIFIAEIYQPQLYRDFIHTAGFDYLYDKEDFYEAARNVIENKFGTQAFTWCWQRLEGLEKYMLRFIENHDEQRIASRFFAGDPWKALPAMVLAATMNSGPLLIYFGQEVGEPAEGISGFSGDDGRTTIFDYWRVPNHQKWMNNGKFDGGSLPGELTSLRENYRSIIRLCNEYKIFSSKGFYDLMWVNQHLYGISSDKLFAYLRYDYHDHALIIVNFGDALIKGAHIIIPEDAYRAINPGEKITVLKQIVFPGGNNSVLTESQVDKGTYYFDISPFSALLVLFH